MVDRAEVARLRWRCRRGMRELDLLMEAWLEHHYCDSAPAMQAAFRQLVDTPDPRLLGWLTGRDRPEDPQTAQLVDAIRART